MLISQAILILKRGGSADEAVVAATIVLENSGLVNAGRGSNLTLEKTVECDAGFMSGNGVFGGVGAVSGVPNPILIAKKLVEQQNDSNELSFGRVPPTYVRFYINLNTFYLQSTVNPAVHSTFNI